MRKADPDLCAALDEERHRLARLVEKLKAALTVERTARARHPGARNSRRLFEAKSLRGMLDFADLIERTQSLLSRADAAWVHYKLDAGIDHILVDEAQDTSPLQWEIYGGSRRISRRA